MLPGGEYLVICIFFIPNGVYELSACSLVLVLCLFDLGWLVWSG